VRLKGRVALVTGSTGEGMGRQIAWTLAREGCDVVLNYGTYRKGAAAARKAVRECEGFGVRAVAVRADTRSEPDVRRLVARAKADFGRLDVVVANAGGDWIERPLEKLSLEAWRKVVAAELDGAFLLAREALPLLRKSPAPRIVSISWDRAAFAKGAPLDYAVGKLARDALMEKLAQELEGTPVTVNTVAPGYIPYPTDAESRDFVRHGKAWAKRTRSQNQDVAEAVAWLCSDEARFVTGSWVRVHGPR
jgi:3-oxoacyl-[acyl-carrier protein] reductase